MANEDIKIIVGNEDITNNIIAGNDDISNNIKQELCKRIKGDIFVDSYGFKGSDIRVVDVMISNVSEHDYFTMSFNLDCFGVSGNNILKAYVQHIVNSVYSKYRDYILSKYFVE